MKNIVRAIVLIFTCLLISESRSYAPGSITLVGPRIHVISDSIALFNLKAVYSPDAEQFFFVWSHEFTLGLKNYAKVRGRFLDLNGKLSEVKTYSFPQFKL